MIEYKNYHLRYKRISVLKYVYNYFFIGYDDGIIEVYTEDFKKLYCKKIHPTIILDIHKIDLYTITFSLTETCIWDLKWNEKQKIINILFHRICPLTENKIVFGTISGNLNIWNDKELKLLPYTFERISLIKLYRIDKKRFISYTPYEIILWENESKKYQEKRNKEWISIVVLFQKDYILIGDSNIILIYLPTFEIKKQWSCSNICTSLLSLDYSHFLAFSKKGDIYLYNIDNENEECIQSNCGDFLLPVSFVKGRKNIFFSFDEYIFEFENPVLVKEEKNYILFLNSIQNFKKNSIFHFKDIAMFISNYLF